MANHGNKIQKFGNHPRCFTETKSRKIFKILIWERHRPWFTGTKSRQKYWVPGHNFFLWNFGNVTERVLRKQNLDHHFWKLNLLERICGDNDHTARDKTHLMIYNSPGKNSVIFISNTNSMIGKSTDNTNADYRRFLVEIIHVTWLKKMKDQK